MRARAPLCVLRAADLAAGGPALQSLHLEAELFEAAAMQAVETDLMNTTIGGG